MADFERELLERLQGIQARQAAKPPPVRGEEPTRVLETFSEDPEPAKEAAADVTAVNIFRHPDAHPYVLSFILLDKYGPEWLIWEPETLELFIDKDFHGGVSHINFAKVQAMKTLHLVDTFWQRWEVFLWCTMALNGVPPDFEIMQVPTVAQCLVAIDIANRVRDDVGWTEEVKAYLQTVFHHDGIFCPQAPADFIELDTEGLPIDCAEIRKLWPDVRVSGRAPSEETVTAEQLRRLLVVNGYLEESRTHLNQQLSVLLRA